MMNELLGADGEEQLVTCLRDQKRDQDRGRQKTFNYDRLSWSP